MYRTPENRFTYENGSLMPCFVTRMQAGFRSLCVIDFVLLQGPLPVAEDCLWKQGLREIGSKERVDQHDAEIRLAVVQILGIQGGATAPLRRGHNQPVVEMNPKGSHGFHGTPHHPGA